MQEGETDDSEQPGDVRIEVYEGEGRHWFRVVFRSQQLLLTGAGHPTRDAALRAIERARDPASTIRACMTADGAFYFDVVAPDGEVLATSTKYPVPGERDAAQALARDLLRTATALPHLEFV
ncbi:MAG TPA: hypothetical protein VFG69_09180 [Nannocystaceae bacterium]|nr:hypothetical protein [Nannocystaceae bacterium]